MGRRPSRRKDHLGAASAQLTRCYRSCYRFNPETGNIGRFTGFHGRRESLDQLELTPMPALRRTRFRRKEFEDHVQKDEE